MPCKHHLDLIYGTLITKITIASLSYLKNHNTATTGINIPYVDQSWNIHQHKEVLEMCQNHL